MFELGNSREFYRLAAPSVSAIIVLAIISLFAVEFTAYSMQGSKRIAFDGHIFDASGDQSLQDILLSINDAQHRFSSSGNNAPEKIQAATTGFHWLWFSPMQFDADFDKFLLELAWLDYVTIFFVAENDGFVRYNAGDDDAFDQRAIDFRKPAFPLIRTIEQSGVTKVVIRVSAQGNFSLPIFTMPEATFNQRTNLDYLFYGAWTSLIIAISFYNASIFFSLRQKVYIYYLVYVAFFASLLIIASGLGQQYFWPTSANTTTFLAHISLALSNAGTAFFVVRFIDLEKYSPALTSALNFFAYLSLICVPFVFTFDYQALPPILISSFIIMLLIVPAAVYTTIKGNLVAPFMLASIIVLLPCNSIGLMRFMGLFEEAYWAEHLAELGMAAEALILSIGLAYRVNLLRLDNNSMLVARERERTRHTKQLISAKEEERKDIGNALHDSLGHKILSIKNYVSSADDRGTNADQAQIKRSTLTMLDDAIEEIRDLSHLLYPAILEHLGLEKSIHNVVSNALAQTNIKYTTNIAKLSLIPELELLLYRASQECTNNVIKHSDANQFRLTITSLDNEDGCIFIAEDNGSKSFSASDFGFGLSMLKQQVAVWEGSLEAERTPQGWNRIIVRFINRD